MDEEQAFGLQLASASQGQRKIVEILTAAMTFVYPPVGRN